MRCGYQYGWYCWGGNFFGQLGSGEHEACAFSGLACKELPYPVVDRRFKSIVAGGHASCGIAIDNPRVLLGMELLRTTRQWSRAGWPQHDRLQYPTSAGPGTDSLGYGPASAVSGSTAADPIALVEVDVERAVDSQVQVGAGDFRNAAEPFRSGVGEAPERTHSYDIVEVGIGSWTSQRYSGIRGPRFCGAFERASFQATLSWRRPYATTRGASPSRPRFGSI